MEHFKPTGRKKIEKTFLSVVLRCSSSQQYSAQGDCAAGLLTGEEPSITM
jgi:hypothetical protein